MRYDVITVRDDTGVRGYSIHDTLKDIHIALSDTIENARFIAQVLNAATELHHCVEYWT